jgi:CNT family concentrative nucleoside transporter
MQILLSLAGMALILLIAFLLSSDRKAIRPRVVLRPLRCRLGLPRWCSYVPWGNRRCRGSATGVSNLLGYANARHRIPVRQARHGSRWGRISRSRRCR